jgi:hypothetical protein
MGKMTAAAAAHYMDARIRYGQFRDQDGSLGKPVALYQLPGSEAWIRERDLIIRALRQWYGTEKKQGASK